MRPEDRARQHIDRSLEQASWKVQDYRELDLTTSFGVAIREFPLGKDHADYMLFVDKKLVGVIEAKPFGTTLSGVAEQSQTYLSSISRLNSEWLPAFAYESTGIETFFRDLRDPDTRSRRVFSFHRPETLANWYASQDTLRKHLRTMSIEHPLNLDRLRDCQVQAIKNVERSFADGRPRSLIQMATGSGKTFTAVSFIYRLIKFA